MFQRTGFNKIAIQATAQMAAGWAAGWAADKEVVGLSRVQMYESRYEDSPKSYLARI